MHTLDKRIERQWKLLAKQCTWEKDPQAGQKLAEH